MMTRCAVCPASRSTLSTLPVPDPLAADADAAGIITQSASAAPQTAFLPSVPIKPPAGVRLLSAEVKSKDRAVERLDRAF